MAMVPVRVVAILVIMLSPRRTPPRSWRLRAARNDQGILSRARGILSVNMKNIRPSATSAPMAAGLGGSGVLLRWIIDATPAVRAGIVLIQPHLNALIVEPVLARKHRDFGAQLH